MRDTSNIEFLVRAAQRGDKAAVADLVERFQPLVWAAARRLAPDLADVDDLAQDANLALLQAIGEFRSGGGAPFVWYAKRQVYWAVQAVARRLKRARSRIELRLNSPGTEELTIGELLADPNPGPEEEVVAAGARSAFQSAWRSLTLRQRQVLAGRAAGLTFAQIAAGLGISPSTAKGIAARGAAQLKKLLADRV